MHDVMPKPEPNPYETQTTIVRSFYFYHDPERKKIAREALRRIGKTDLYQKEDGMADVALEEIWNILLGN